MGKTHITLLLVVAFSVSLTGQISFRQASYNQCKTTAITSQLPFVVYVTARWCLNCKLMEETTFRSQGLRMAVDGKYNTYKIDFDSHAAKEWKEKFGIRSVPAFLVFDEHGAMVQRVDKSLTSSKIIDLLKSPENFSQKNQTLNTTTYTHEYAAGPYKNDFFNWKQACEKLSRNRTAVKKVAPATVVSTFVEEVSPSEIDHQYLSFNLTPSDMKVVEVFKSEQIKISDKRGSKRKRALFKRNKTKKIAPKIKQNEERLTTEAKPQDEPVAFGKKMYRIQFGVFSKLSDAQGLVSTLRGIQPHPIFTLHETRAGKPIYRVVVGKFHSKEEARQIKQDIYVKGLRALVIEI